MQISIHSGGRALVSSGNLILPPQQKTFSIQLDNIELIVVFVDISKPSGTYTPISNYVITGPTTGTITLTDWINPLGTSNELTNMAFINGQNISIAFHVMNLGDGDGAIRVCQYSIFSANP